MPTREAERKITAYIRNPETGKLVPVVEIDAVETFNEYYEDQPLQIKGMYSVTFKLHVARSRKRFIKLLMANGVDRNTANLVADSYNKQGYSWRSAFFNFLLVL